MKVSRFARASVLHRATSKVFEALESRTLLAATRIMPLGDSITEAFTGHASYRYWLHKSLVQAGFDVDFVGSQTGVANGPPLFGDFDQNHEGHSGFRADQIQANVVSYATQNNPEIVLLHIGTNDVAQGQSASSTIADVAGIIDNLRIINPNVKILLAKIIPNSVNAAVTTQFNDLIPALVGTKNTAQSPVIMVDQFAGFDVATDLYDGLHPDESGEQKIAAKWQTALAPLLTPGNPPPAGTSFLSDLNPTSAINGWGPYERDRSNGETGATDGRTITLNGATYTKGLGTHANSDITYNIAGGGYTEFRADIGVDDEVGNNGNVVFRVLVDGVQVYDSGAMTGASATKQVVIPLNNASTLRLIVNDNGNGNGFDHADWANARVIVGTPITPPAAPTGLDANVNGNKIDLSWTDNASDEVGYRIERKFGGGSYVQIGETAANATSFSDITAAPGVAYTYRVYAFKAGANSAPSNEDSATIPVAPGTIFVSDLPYVQNSNGWGNVEKDKSNGEIGPNDGRTITLGGVTYTKGLGAHANSEITVTLNGQYTQFLSDIGVDDEVGNNGSLVFQVLVDGAQVFDSGLMTGASATQQVNLNVTGATTLKLILRDGGNGNGFDHGDWANARLVAGEPIPTPDAPSNLNAVANGNQIDLTWLDNAGDETGYKVERKLGAGGTYSVIATLGVDATSFSDTSALVGLTYFYRVYAFNNGGASGLSNEANATIPVAPGTIYVSDLPFVVNANGYGNVEKDKSNGEAGPNDGKTITLAGTTYTKGLGVHAYSEITVTLNGQYTQFLSDIGLDDEVGNNGQVVFEVLVDGASVFNSGIMTGSSPTQQVNISVAGATTLKLIVRDGGNGNGFDHADWAGARLIAGAPVTPPAAPSDLQAVSSVDKIDLTWADNADDETGFRIERKAGVDGVYSQIADLPADSISFSDTTLSPGVTYFYRAYAYRSGANSGYSNEASAVAPAPQGIVYLSDLPFVVNENGWGPVERDRSNGQSGPSDGAPITLNGRVYSKGVGVHSISDITLDLNGQYTRFQADVGIDDEVGNLGSVIFQVFLDGNNIFSSSTLTGSSASETIDVDLTGGSTLRLLVTEAGNKDFDHADWADARLTLGPVVTAPAAPSNLDATLNGDQVDLTWSDNSSDEAGFRVERKLGAGGTFAPIATVGPDQTSYSDTDNLDPETEYFYRVVAFKNPNVSSAPSNEDSIVTPAEPPTGTDVYLSDLTETSSSNGFGPVEKDMSNGGEAAGDGTTITIQGVTYAKGLGTHANSEIVYSLGGLYISFLADVGVDDEIGDNGTVTFEVYVDDVLKFDSGLVTGLQGATSVNVDVTGAQALRLVVTNNGDGFDFDHADWANARLTTAPVVAPAAPSDLDATLNGDQVDLTWTDNSSDEDGFRVERKLGSGGTYAPIATLGANETSYADTDDLDPETEYFYRVIAFKNPNLDSAPSNEDSVVTPADPPTGTDVYLSDLTETSSSNGFGPIEKDLSNGNEAAGDGSTITIQGVTYAKGLGTHANSEIIYSLGGSYTTFHAEVGVDDEIGDNGTVTFEVYVDDVLKFDSGTVTGLQAAVPVTVDVTGAQVLKLVVTNNGDGFDYDHADWANARLTPGSSTPLAWWDDNFHFRKEISVGAGVHARVNHTVDQAMNFTSTLAGLGQSGSLILDSIRVVETSGDGQTVIDADVPFQFDPATDYDASTNAAGNLVLLLEGSTAANATRHYHVYFDIAGTFTAPTFTPLVNTTDGVTDEGFASIQIATQTATYFYQKAEGGFSSILDANGNDWVGWNSNTNPGSAGEFRGIPNLGAVGFHPGRDSDITTTIVTSGPLKTTLESTDTDGNKVRWEFYSHFARLSVLSMNQDYWFLYEGTPGGSIDANDSVVRSDGTSTGIGEEWNETNGLGSSNGQEWVYFRDSGVGANGRFMYFVHDQADALIDSYWNLDNNMTVFGFGRSNNPEHTSSTAHLSGLNSFTIGLADGGTTFSDAAATVNGSSGEVTLTLGPAHQRPT